MEPTPNRLIAQCPLCHANYPAAGMRLCSDAGNTGMSKVYHCACSGCGYAMIAVVLETTGWSSSVGMITDLQFADVQRLEALPGLAADECVRFHEVLAHDSAKLCQRLLVTTEPKKG